MNNVQTPLSKRWSAAQQVRDLFDELAATDVHLIGHQLHHYDGPDFIGLEVGELGTHGALTRTESLVFTGELLNQAYSDRRPFYLGGDAGLPDNAPADFGDNAGYRNIPDWHYPKEFICLYLGRPHWGLAFTALGNMSGRFVGLVWSEDHTSPVWWFRASLWANKIRKPPLG